MSAETLTIVLKADGSGLTGTVRASTDAVRQFGLTADRAGRQVEGAGQRSRRAARDVDELGRSTRRTDSSMRAWTSGLNTLRGTLATLGITLVAREMLNAGLAMDRLERSTAAALGSQSMAARELAFVRREAQRLGIYFPVLAQGYAGLAAATRGTVLAGQQTREIFLAVAEAGRAMNLSQEQIAGTLTALQQIAGKGTVSMEELRQQLGDRLPGAMQIAARSMGMTVAEFVKMVAAGELLSAEFLPAFARGMRDAAAAGVELSQNSPAAEFERLKTAIFDAGVALARGGVLDSLAAGARVFAQALNALVAGGSLQTIASLMLKFTAAAAIIFVGSKLHVGLKALQADWNAQRIVVNQALVGVVGLTGATTRLTVAQTAAAVASRSLASGLALVGGPIGLLVIAITAAVAGISELVKAEERRQREFDEGIQKTREMTAEIRELIAARQELAALEPVSLQVSLDTEDSAKQVVAERRQELDELRRQLAETEADMAEADAQRVRLRYTEAGNAAALAYANAANQAEELREQIHSLTPEVEALTRETERLAESNSPYMTKAANDAAAAMGRLANQPGVVDGLGLQESALFDLAGAAALVSQNLAKIDAADLAARSISGQLQQAGAAARQEAAEVGRTAVQVAEAKAAEAEAAARAAGWTEAQISTQRLANNAAIEGLRVLEQAKAAEKERQKQQRAAEQFARQAAREAERQAASQARYVVELERAEAQLSGPLAVAETEHRQRVAELDAELAAHNITQDTANRLKAVSEEQYRRTTAEIEREQDVMSQVQQDYAEEIRLLGLSVAERQVELELRDRINDARRAGRELTPGEIEDLRSLIAVQQTVLGVMEQQAAQATEFERMWDGAIESVAQAFGDWVTGAMDQYDSFGDALKDITRRFLADIVAEFTRDNVLNPIKKWFREVTSGGFAQAGNQGSGGGFWSAIFGGAGNGNGSGGGLMSTLFGSVGRFFGGGSGASTGSATAGIGSLMGFGNNTDVLVAMPGAGGTGGGGFSLSGGGMISKFLTQQTAGGMYYGSAIGGIAGLYYGATQRGNGGLSSAAAGLSYGAAGLAAGGAISGGLAAATAGTSIGAGALGGATGSFAALGGAAWIPVVGWILAAMALVDAVSGGKLFGTKYKLDSSAVNLDFGPGGARGTQEITEVRQRSLFRGRKWRTTERALDAEAQAAINDVFEQMNQAIATAARQIGIDAPDMVVASFRQEYDKKGKLKNEYGTIAGVRYDESQETFFQRLGLENLLQVAKAVGAAGEIETLAGGYRSNVEALQDFTTLMLAVQGDIQNATQLWSASGDGVLTRVVELIERMGNGSETLVQTYQRLTQGALEYGNLIAGVEQQLLTADLSDYQRAALDIEISYRQQVQQANALAKALGLSGARAEDLAKIEELRALNMANLQKQMEAQRDTFLQDLSLSELSPLTDQQKLNESMQALQEAVATGDLARAQSLAQTALGLGRNLYASGADYNALYGQVTGLVGSIGLGDPALEDGTTMGELADILLDLPQQFASALFDMLLAPPPSTVPPPVTPPTNPGSGGGTSPGPVAPPGGGGLRDPNSPWHHVLATLAKIEANTGSSAQTSASAALRELNSRGAAR